MLSYLDFPFEQEIHMTRDIPFGEHTVHFNENPTTTALRGDLNLPPRPRTEYFERDQLINNHIAFPSVKLAQDDVEFIKGNLSYSAILQIQLISHTNQTSKFIHLYLYPRVNPFAFFNLLHLHLWRLLRILLGNYNEAISLQTPLLP